MFDIVVAQSTVFSWQLNIKSIAIINQEYVNKSLVT